MRVAREPCIEATELQWKSTACPVCKGKERRYLFEDRNRRENLPLKSTYLECLSCGMIYLSPVPDWGQFQKYYEWLASRAPEEAFSKSNVLPGDRSGWLGRVLWSLRRFRFRPHSWPAEEGKDRRLLEVGCGDAAKLVEFAARAWKVVGLDISATALERARHNLSIGEFHKGELGQVRLPLHSFHVVRMDNVLEHVPNPLETVTRCVDLLVPDQGRLFVYVPHGRSLSMRLLGRYSNNSWIPFHFSLFPRSALHRMLLEAGFKQVEILTYSPIHALPSSLLQALGRANDLRGWGRVQWPVYLALAPVGWIADRLDMGEELIAIART